MKTLRRSLLAFGLLLVASPVLEAVANAETGTSQVRQASLPALLGAAERESYQAIFADLRTQNWAGAAARLDAIRAGPLHDLARAMLYTAPGSPRVELTPLMALIARAPDLPQAAELSRLAAARGAVEAPYFTPARNLFGLPGQPRRARARNIRGDAVADALEPLIQPLLVQDQPFAAESLFNERRDELTEEARTAFLQRIAWVYYLNGNDRDARRLAEEAGRGATEWAVHAEWVAGLAAWRMGDCEAAAQRFATVAVRSHDVELSAGGHYWASRSDTACGHPERAQGRLQMAARSGETFYGLLAQSALGVRYVPATLDAFTVADWNALSGLANIRTAIALTEIGETQLAGEVLRHQARIGDPRHHESLLHLAGRLNLTSAQMWLAHNGPRGTRTPTHDRYPEPSWRPRDGWRVEPALAFAHALQESNFRPDAVSPAGARGLMQVRPGTAGDLIRWRGIAADPNRLTNPADNMAFGQAYLEYLRDQPGINGLLPRVIAAYNAGPAPIAQWSQRFDQSDPLLFIESIPYWETRGYVPIVLRNYWIYEQRTGADSPSRRALVAGLWPRFPGLPGATAVRIESRRPQTAMGGPEEVPAPLEPSR